MPLNIDFQQIFIHMFNFVILGGGLYLLLYKPVKDFMDKRAAYFQKMEDDAKANLQQAEDAKAEYEAKIANIEQEADEIRKASVAKADAINEANLQQAQKEAEQILKVARINSQREKQKSIEEAKEEIANMAIEATRKLLEEKNDPYRSFVEAAKQGEE